MIGKRTESNQSVIHNRPSCSIYFALQDTIIDVIPYVRRVRSQPLVGYYRRASACGIVKYVVNIFCDQTSSCSLAPLSKSLNVIQER